MSDFDRALAAMRREECHPGCVKGNHAACFTNDPADPGGATCCGIIQHTYDAYRAGKKVPLQPVHRHTWEEHADIYRTRFWERGRCPLLPWPLSAAHFDACVNHGTEAKDAKGRRKISAVVLLQRALRVADDGVFGPGTETALAAALATGQAGELGNRMLLERVFRYDELVDQNPKLAKFLTGGWLGRLEHHYRGFA